MTENNQNCSLSCRRVPEKILQIRLALGLSESEIYEKLYTDLPASVVLIGLYESGEAEPSLLEVLDYSRLAGVSMEQIIDDSLDLDSAVFPLLR